MRSTSVLLRFFMPTSSKKVLQRFFFVCFAFYSLFGVLRVISSCFAVRKTCKAKYVSYSYFTVIFDIQTNKMESNSIKYMFLFVFKMITNSYIPGVLLSFFKSSTAVCLILLKLYSEDA